MMVVYQADQTYWHHQDCWIAGGDGAFYLKGVGEPKGKWGPRRLGRLQKMCDDYSKLWKSKRFLQLLMVYREFIVSFSWIPCRWL